MNVEALNEATADLPAEKVLRLSQSIPVNWFRCDDKAVWRLNEKVGEQRSQDAYLLVYTKKDELEKRQQEVCVIPAHLNFPGQRSSWTAQPRTGRSSQ